MIKPALIKTVNARRGVVLLFVMLVLSALLSIASGIFTLTLGQILITGRAEDSFRALYSTDQGLERTLYREFVSFSLNCSPTCTENSEVIYPSEIPSGGCYTADITRSGSPSVTTIKIVGQYRCPATAGRLVKRAFEYTYLTPLPPVPPFDYTISPPQAPAPADINVTQTDSGSNTITATYISGTADAVIFSASGLPSGATPGFAPTNCTPLPLSCTSTLTITTVSTPTGSYPITVTGTSVGGVTRTVNFTLNVSALPSFDYAFSPVPNNVSVAQGSPVSNQINLSLLSGTSQSVSLSAISTPAESTITYNNPFCTPDCFTNLQITTTGATPPNIYNITVTGNPLGKTTAFNLTVNPVALFPQVAAVNGGAKDSEGSNHSINLPAGIVSGNLLVVFFSVDGAPTVTWPSGWTQLYSVSNNGIHQARYRIANGTEGATISINTSTPEQSSHTSYRITGNRTSGTLIESSTANGSSNAPNSPNLSPSWGAANTLWLTVYNSSQGSITTNAYPLNYLNGRTDDTVSEGQGSAVGSARRELNASGENPGAFTLSGSVDWVAATVGIRPQ